MPAFNALVCTTIPTECWSYLPKQPVWNLYEVRRGKSKAPDRSPERQDTMDYTWIMAENYRAVDKNNMVA